MRSFVTFKVGNLCFCDISLQLCNYLHLTMLFHIYSGFNMQNFEYFWKNLLIFVFFFPEFSNVEDPRYQVNGQVHSLSFD